MSEPLRLVEDAARVLVVLLEGLSRQHGTTDSAYLLGDGRRLLGRVEVYATKLFGGVQPCTHLESDFNRESCRRCGALKGNEPQ